MEIEIYRKVLNSALLGNTLEDYHISAMTHAMGKYWQVQMKDLYNTMIMNPKSNEEALRSMVNILACEFVSSMNSNDYECIRVSELARLQKYFFWIEPLQKHLSMQRRVNIPLNGHMQTWRGFGDTSTCYTDAVKRGMQLVTANTH